VKAVWAVTVSALTLLAYVRRRFFVATVVGVSMLPTLKPGDRVLMHKAGSRMRLAAGDIVALKLPELDPEPEWAELTRGPGLYIKRIVATEGEPVPWPLVDACDGASLVPAGTLLVLGDGPKSLDSKAFGPIRSCAVIGRAVRRLPTLSSPETDRGAHVHDSQSATGT
jgi:signal peptidase I